MVVNLLLALAALALALGALQAVCLWRHAEQRTSGSRAACGRWSDLSRGRSMDLPFISVLKPLCGVDDDLLRNLGSFARLDYPRFEILLGVKDERDSAHALAVRAAQKWSDRMRVVVQRSAPGLNPKVNQLITLAASARGEILVVSDSNIRVAGDYLRGIAAAFEDERVALVTHPVAGVGERSTGSLFDNAQLCATVAPGVVAAKRLAGKDLVVGKSMALRRSDLRAMGGFERLKDVLAEDFIAGQLVRRELGKKVMVAAREVQNVSRRQTVSAFFARYLRWSIMQRHAVGTPAYAAQILLNAPALAALALVATPTRATALAFGAVACIRAAIIELCARRLRGHGFGARSLLAVGGELVVGAAWFCGFLRSEVNWRGNRLAVLAGTRLERLPDRAFAEPQVEPG